MTDKKAGAKARPRLGVPYARAEVVGGKLFRVCPVCKVWIEEVSDRDGEQETNLYGLHYVRNHREDENDGEGQEG